MLTEVGRVVAVEEQAVWVETIRKSTCGSCAAQAGCGHGLLNRLGDGRANRVRVLPGTAAPEDCRLNDQVRISIPESLLLRGSFVVYILPLVGMLGGAAVATTVYPGAGDVPAFTGAALGFLCGLALVRWHAIRHRDDRSLQPTLVEVLGPAVQPG